MSNITKISYKRNFLLNPVTLEHEHIGVEIELNEFDNAEKVLNDAKTFVERFGNYVPETKLEKLEPPDWTITKQQLDTFHYREDAMNFLKLNGLTYFKELNDLVSLKPLKGI